MREVNSFSGEEARLAPGQVEPAALTRLPGKKPCASWSRREVSKIQADRRKGQPWELKLAMGRTMRVKWLMVC